jgi:site-specific recombinase XerD
MSPSSHAEFCDCGGGHIGTNAALAFRCRVVLGKSPELRTAPERARASDLPLSKELEARLRTHLQRQDHKNELLFVNRGGRPFSANKLREKQVHPLLDALGITRGGFHSMRHGAASSLLDDGATPAVVQKQLRHSDARITLELYGHVIGDEQRNAVQNRSIKLVN